MPQTEVLLLSSRLTWHAGLIHPEKMRKIPFPYLHRVCVWKGEPNFFQVGLGYKTTVYCVCHVRMAIPAFNKNPFSTVKHCRAVFFPSSCFYVKARKKSGVTYIFHPFGAKQFKAILRQMALNMMEFPGSRGRVAYISIQGFKNMIILLTKQPWMAILPFMNTSLVKLLSW